MKKLSSLSLESILEDYEFPHRFLVYFASQCAKDAQGLSKKTPDPRTLTAIDVAERFGNGEEFTPEYLDRVRDDARAAAADARAYAAAATYAAYAAADATYTAATAATYATYAARAAARAACATYATYAARAAATVATLDTATDYYKPLLLSLIEARLTELERLLILGSI